MLIQAIETFTNDSLKARGCGRKEPFSVLLIKFQFHMSLLETLSYKNDV